MGHIGTAALTLAHGRGGAQSYKKHYSLIVGGVGALIHSVWVCVFVCVEFDKIQ